MKNLNKKGFTLIEVLIAMTILSITLIAVIKTVTAQSKNIYYLKTKSIANLIASNKLIEIELQKTWPNIGITKGNEKMADNIWYWEVNVSKTPDNNVRRLEINIKKSPTDKNFITTLIGYTGKQKVALE